MAATPSTPDLTIRRASRADLPAILTLAQRSLGWLGDAADARFLEWKHFENPFGESPMWVAESDGRLAGFRTFLRWDLATPDGEVRHAVRAVDTATDPDFQGRGIFTRLTLAALDELRAEGIDFVFNTPNDQSRPGYLKMGWRVVGRLRAAARLSALSSLPLLVRARQPASLEAVAVTIGAAAREAFADTEALGALLADAPRRSGVHTPKTPQFLAWRYGLPRLRYRVVTAPGGVANGLAAFRLRRRGAALEAVIGDVLVPTSDPGGGARLLGRIARETGADYLLGLDSPGARLGLGQGFWWVPGAGPTLTTRAVTTDPPLDVRAWALTMGDVELF